MAEMTGGLTIQRPDKKLVLVIDDDQMVRKLLKKVAKTLDLVVIEAQDGKDALQFLKENTPILGLPDLILVDVYMPNMDGISFCKNIKQEFSFPSNKIIIISAVSQKEDLEKINQFQEIDFIAKPFSIGQVRQTIKTKLDQVFGTDVIGSEPPIAKEPSVNKLTEFPKDKPITLSTTNDVPETPCQKPQTNNVSNVFSDENQTKDALIQFIEKLYLLNSPFFTETFNNTEETQTEIKEHLNLGTSYFEMGLFDDAIEELLQAVNLAEEFHFYSVKFQSCILLAQCFLYKESFGNSIMWLNNILEPMGYQQPTALNLLYELGQIYQSIEKPKEALEVHL